MKLLYLESALLSLLDSCHKTERPYSGLGYHLSIQVAKVWFSEHKEHVNGRPLERIDAMDSWVIRSVANHSAEWLRETCGLN